MPLPLSYPGLKCVLENLEAVKRAHIIGRSPGLQKIDKLIPLRLKDFYIMSNEMTINNWIIRYYENYEVKFCSVFDNGKTFSREGSASLEDKMKKLVNFYICGRSIIHVDTLCWLDSLFSHFLPVDMKFRVNSLNAPLQFDAAVPFIDPRSFPLKTLDTFIANDSTFDDPVVKFAETLNLNFIIDRTVTVEDMKRLNNQKVVFDYWSSSRIDIIPLIKYHVETKKIIKTTFVISTSKFYVIREMLSELELAFKEFQCDLECDFDFNERFLVGSSRYSIPINDESRIHVYAVSLDNSYKIIVKPVSGL